jgi:hypothetical protein
VRDSTIRESPEFFALANLFISSAGPWAHEDVVTVMCEAIWTSKLPPEAMYVLKAMFVIDGHADSTGAIPVAMFTEIVVRPFAVGSGTDPGFACVTERLLRGDRAVVEVHNAIEDAVMTTLERRVSSIVRPDTLEVQPFEIYHFISQKIDEFIRLVILMNTEWRRRATLCCRSSDLRTRKPREEGIDAGGLAEAAAFWALVKGQVTQYNQSSKVVSSPKVGRR